LCAQEIEIEEEEEEEEEEEKEIRFIHSILAIARLVLETGTFDPHTRKNADIFATPPVAQARHQLGLCQLAKELVIGSFNGQR
jgi:TATA-binding protein-associated factor Taf7